MYNALQITNYVLIFSSRLVVIPYRITGARVNFLLVLLRWYANFILFNKFKAVTISQWNSDIIYNNDINNGNNNENVDGDERLLLKDGRSVAGNGRSVLEDGRSVLEDGWSAVDDSRSVLNKGRSGDEQSLPQDGWSVAAWDERSILERWSVGDPSIAGADRSVDRHVGWIDGCGRSAAEAEDVRGMMGTLILCSMRWLIRIGMVWKGWNRWNAVKRDFLQSLVWKRMIPPNDVRLYCNFVRHDLESLSLYSPDSKFSGPRTWSHSCQPWQTSICYLLPQNRWINVTLFNFSKT